MTGYSTIAEVRVKLCFVLPVEKEPQTSGSNSKVIINSRPVADVDKDGSYEDDVIVVKAADETPVTVTAVNHLTGEVTLESTPDTAVLVSYYYEKDGHAGAVSDSAIETWIDDVKALIDSRLKKIYTVPFTDSPPPEIKKVSSDMISGRLLMQVYTTNAAAEHSWAKNRYEWAEEYLKDLETGNAKILGQAVRRQAQSEFEDVPPIFTMKESTYLYKKNPYEEDSEGT